MANLIKDAAAILNASIGVPYAEWSYAYRRATRQQKLTTATALLKNLWIAKKGRNVPAKIPNTVACDPTWQIPVMTEQQLTRFLDKAVKEMEKVK